MPTRLGGGSMIVHPDAYEARAIRESARMAIDESRRYEKRWSIGREGDADSPGWHGAVRGDAADVFVETFLHELRRHGGVVFFVE